MPKHPNVFARIILTDAFYIKVLISLKSAEASRGALITSGCILSVLFPISLDPGALWFDARLIRRAGEEDGNTFNERP